MEEGMISINKWEQPSKAYFLTHLHPDYTVGLSRRWKRGPLFCSPLTSLLLPAAFPGFDPFLIHVLQLGTTFPLRLPSDSKGEEVVVHVTAIDANHCPGAVMYLFQGNFGNYLYTGNFRWESGSESTEKGKSILCERLKGMKVDSLLIDNTYCNPLFAFPSRENAAQQGRTTCRTANYVQDAISIYSYFTLSADCNFLEFDKVVDIIAAHPYHEIVIGIDTLGKEDLLLYVARALKTKIWVWPERLQTMHILGFMDTFTTNISLTRIHAIPLQSFSVETLVALNKARRSTIGILPSGLPWVFYNKDNRKNRKNRSCKRLCADSSQSSTSLTTPKWLHQYICLIQYSDHSCYSEIKEFIELVQPSYTKGHVSSSDFNINPSHYFGILAASEDHSDKLGNSNHEKLDINSEGSFQKTKIDGQFSHERKSFTVSSSSRKRNLSRLRREKRGVHIKDSEDI